MIKAYTFNDVLIAPRYSEIESRSNVDLSTQIGHVKLKIPIISSNMKTVTGPKMAAEIAKLGGLGLLHRFCTIEDNLDMYTQAWQLVENVSCPSGLGQNIGVSIGVKDEDKERFEKLYNLGARTFCIDVAHGHHILVKKMLEWIDSFKVMRKLQDPLEKLTIIAGNIATPEAYNDLCDWGADVVKVGIGPGSACATRKNTGVGIPQLYALEMINDALIHHPQPASIIADGGLVHVGDIAKALKFADAVMLGSMFSGTAESPGHVFRNEQNEFYKVYGGSASGENKGENKFVEGVMKTVKFKGKVKYIVREIEDGLRSTFSYVGVDNLIAFQTKCEFIHISDASRTESKI